MGYVHAEIKLKNPRLDDLKPVIVKAMVDTGALTLYIPEHVALQMKLATNTQREVTTADGRKHMVPYVGPIEVLFENRNCFVGALVLGDEVLLGVVPMEDMDLVISPAQRRLVVNPESPNFPQALVKKNRNRCYSFSENDFGKARGKNPSKSYVCYVVEDFDR